ncbi:MAG: GGDEF domain-containing protein [Candidatus Tritonobacter lacicola]|nr:GGDEF domain-containing protein [Candidatus Tritonobacter lacicola]
MDDRTIVHRKRAGRQGGAQERKATLIVISGGQAGQMFPLTGPEVLIGRAGKCDIILEDNGVSRTHARLLRVASGKYRIEDLQSTNGTYCNTRRIDAHVLREGDKLHIGSITLKFSYQDNIEEQFQKELYESATRDGLTGIYNRRFFDDHFRGEFSYAQRQRCPISLVLIDVDYFKRINDAHGHEAGDHVLRGLAKTIFGVIRREDIFCRYGGEEFVIILKGVDGEEALVNATRLRRLVEKTEFTFGGKLLPVRISIGIATLNNVNFRDHKEMFQAADRYLYLAKSKGRNRVESALTREKTGSGTA